MASRAKTRDLLLALLLRIASPAAAETTRGTFDPDTCWQDNGGKIIIRLISGVAFAFEPVFFSARVGWGPIVGPDLPPEGCPGNLLVVNSIGFPNWPDWPVAEGALKHETNQLERLGIFGHEGPLHIQRGALRLFENLIKQYGTEHCEMLPSQLEVCRACSSVQGKTQLCNDRWKDEANQPKIVGYDRVPARYHALPGAYFEHNGIPFVGGCTWPVWIDTPRWCQFRYQIEDGLTVSYKINDWKVPETEFIAFDRKIREMTLAARAPEYDATPEEMERFQ